MPTFGLSDEEPRNGYLGSNEMYFRQWRAPSMNQVFEKRRDREFLEAEAKKENMIKQRELKKKEHEKKFNEKMRRITEDLERKAAISEAPQPQFELFRRPTAEEKRQAYERLQKEYLEPSSTARMVPARQLPLKPRATPIFGNAMASHTNIVKPPKVVLPPVKNTFSKVINLPKTQAQTPEEQAGTPKDNSFLNNSHETVFYPQAHNSFNLDSYNGTRPSFAFPTLSGATSTPVSKSFPKFSGGSGPQILEESSIFDDSKYVTALESPVSTRSGSVFAPDEVKIEFGAPPSVAQKKREEARRKDEEKMRIMIEKERQARQREIEEETREKERKRVEEETQRKLDNERKRQEEIEETQRKLDNERKRQEEETQRRLDNERMMLEEETQRQRLIATMKEREAQRIREEEEARQAEEEARHAEEEEYGEEEEIEDEEDDRKTPYSVFEKYILLKDRVEREKKEYEDVTEPNYRAHIKRTINEKINIYTKKETDTETREIILQFFKKMLKKEVVEGFAIEGSNPLKLNEVTDVNYAIHIIVERYMNLVEQDIDLATSIADLISRLSSIFKRLETVFICLMMNKSVVLRQIKEECKNFVESTNDPDERKINNNREEALVTLFLNVFARNSLLAIKRPNMVLNEDLLWEYADAVIDHGLEVAKSAMIITILITTCKPRLIKRPEQWHDFKSYLTLEFLSILQEDCHERDISNVERLCQIAQSLE